MVRDNNLKLWIPISIVLAVGFLNKYSVLFFIAGFFLTFIVEGKMKLLFSRYFLIGLFSGLIIILPNIIWQYNHGWPVRMHMEELKSNQLDLLGYSGFFSYLFSFSQGSIIVWIIGLSSLLFYKGEKKYRYLGVATLIIMLLFLAMKGKGYYVLGLLPFLFSFTGYLFEKYMTGTLRFLKWGIISISLIMSLVVLPSGIPILSFDSYERYLNATRSFISHPLIEWDNGETHQFPQAYADMTGWKELTSYVVKAFNSLTVGEKKKCTIYCERSYANAGAVYFYGREYGLPLPVTFHDSYSLWAPDSIPDGPMIFIFRRKNDVEKLFSDIKEVGCVDNKYFRERGLKVFLCKSPVDDVCAIYRKKAIEEKNKFRPRSKTI
jgi:hypothetical protein